MGKRIVVALGGNAIKQIDERGTSDEQIRNCETTCRLLAKLIKEMKQEDRLIITHGNGPQAGNLLLQHEASRNLVPAQPLDIVGAMTQGQIGYMLQQSLVNFLRAEGVDVPVCTVITQVVVDKNDPEFSSENASKPVGDFFSEAEAKAIKNEHPEYIMKKVKPVGEKAWRRVVPSPDPIAIVEASAIKKFVETGLIVIASGGGGIPVALDVKGRYCGVEAVVDKDLAGEKLAETVGANIFLILTDVNNVKLNFGKPNEKNISRMSLTEAKNHLRKGQFLRGSMEPKVKACIRFLESGGEKAIITSLDEVDKALQGKAGTLVYQY